MSERAYKYIDDDAIVMNNGDRMVDASTAYVAVDIAEMEMIDKAGKLFEKYLSGVLQLGTAKKISEKFKQKLEEQ